METVGEIGAIFKDDRQIGGFFYWKFTIKLVGGNSYDARSYETKGWEGEARWYWLEEAVDIAEVRFYSDTNFYWKTECQIQAHPKFWGVLVKEPIRFKGLGSLEAVDVKP